MKIEEIVEQTKLYFGKNRRRLKNKILSFEFDGKEYRNWNKQLKQIISKPYDVRYGMFDDVIEWLKEENYAEIDWHWLGNLSWEFQILLNDNVEKGFDWDKKLAIKCGGTARILQVYLSDIVPCFVVDTYYMTYNKKENYYEFGPIEKLSDEERKIVNKFKKFFRDKGFTFLSKEISMKRYKEFYSDCNSDGNARLFDALFSDTDNYEDEIRRFNSHDSRKLKDATGKMVNWNEYYDKAHKLIKREEYTYYPSKNVTCITTDKLGQITEVKVWRDIEKFTHREFVLDILEEHEKKKLKEKRKLNKTNPSNAKQSAYKPEN